MKKKKKEKYKKIAISIFAIIITFILFFYFINDNSNNNFLFNTLKDLTANISKITSLSFNSKKTLDNNIMVKEINNDYKKEIESLKKALELNSSNSLKKFVNATVVKRSTDYWYNLITIDKGKKDNVKVGFAVINNDGLIGKVIKVNNNTSDIKLLISPKEENYISAGFNYENNEYYGLIDDYDVTKNELLLKNVVGEFNKENIIGTNVTTSGLSDSFTSGLLIGKIKDIKKDKFGISYDILVEPSVNFNNINIVSVVVGDK